VPDKEEEVKPKRERAPRKKKDAEATLPPADTEATDAAPAKGAYSSLSSPDQGENDRQVSRPRLHVKATVGICATCPGASWASTSE